MFDHAASRAFMVERQIARRGLRDARVLQAMGETPREAFVAPDLEELAYADRPLPIGHGQTISQPYVVALMLVAAELRPLDRVLEIGTGSGYAAAVMSRLCGAVFTIERHGELAAQARERLARLGCGNVEVRIGDGTRGWPERAPFDAIVAAAGGRSIPEPLRRQLAIGGRLIIPVGEPSRRQRLLKITRLGAAEFSEEDLGHVRFVPLIGEPDPPQER